MCSSKLTSLLAFFGSTHIIPTFALPRATDAADDTNATHWFTQPIDHSGGHNGTFQQKFFISTECYKPGGPILMFQGEESSVLDSINSTIMYDFARELNGIVVNLEHRYFGESVPFGSDLATYTPDEWQFLTLDNVMQDAVTFVDSVRANVTGAKSAPVFVASGSYGGFLMTAFRQNHPETFKGVIASAPSIRSFYGGNETNVPDQFNWWTYISKTWQGHSSLAATKITRAFATLAERFEQNKTSTLQSELNLCDSVTDNSATALLYISSMMRQVFSFAVEFNYNTAKPGRSPISNPLEKWTSIILDEEDPLQILNRTNHLWYSESAVTADTTYTCFNISNPAGMIQLSVPLISTVPFQYITCTYAALGVSLVDNGTIFPASTYAGLQNAAATKICQGQYGAHAPASTDFYEKYHFTDAELQESTGIIFSVAEWDPTTGVSGLYSFNLPLRPDTYASKRIFTTGMAHREDLFAQDENTRESVKNTNRIELETLKEWMALERDQ